MLVVSVQAETPPIFESNKEDEENSVVGSVDQFRSIFGATRTPTDMTAGDLVGWKLARLYRRVILDEITDALAVFNAGRGVGQRLQFKQVISIEYKDGAKMTKIGGVFVDEGQDPIYQSCDFERLAFFRGSLDALRLEVPKLTPKEMREIERSLPAQDVTSLEVDHLPSSDVKAFALWYRYLPSFASFEP